MKNLYLFSLLSMLFCLNSIGQNLQNSNWVTGSFQQQNLINFNPNANPLNTFNNTNSHNGNCEGVASVSDLDGNLLFYTDGIRVFQRIGAADVLINPNNLLRGDASSTQNAIIVPRPGFLKKYYIFTIVGGTSGTSSPNRGLFYTEFDFSNPAGGVVVAGTLNTPLRDNNNVEINGSRFNHSEGLTSTKHGNCQDYWVVAHVTRTNNPNQGDIFSYQVTQNGVVGNLPSSTLNFNPPLGNVLYTLKISPNSNRIGFTFGDEGLYLGGFNNLTGAVTVGNTATIPGNFNGYFYGLEFSQNSNMLYYSDNTNLITQYDILNDTTQSVNPQNQNVDFFGGLQLGQDNRLYATTFLTNGTQGLSVINNSNILNSVMDNYIPLGTTTSYGLPQLVMSHDCCLPDLTLTSPLDDMDNNSLDNNSHREREFWIRATNHITVGNNNFGDGVVYHAGDFVELNPGFEAVSGSQFSAYIEGCSNDYEYKNSSSNEDVKNDITDLIKNKISVYPNPTSGLLNISLSNNKIKKIMLTSIEGKVYVFEQFNNTENAVLDLSNYASGIYLMNVETDQGEIINSKVIKN